MSANELIYTRVPLQIEADLDEGERYVTAVGDVIVATFLVQDDEDLHPTISDEERDGNARLFVVAPEMLRALVAQESADQHFRDCRTCMADIDGQAWHCSQYQNLAAIARTLRCEALRRLA